jgi:hypothetical protein
MVQHPDTAIKACGTEAPTSSQHNEAASASRLPCCPKFFSSTVTKSEGVIPSADWDLTDVTKVLAISSRASASATCSLGFCTALWKDMSFLFAIIPQ